jgi:formylglycine-generating enzyme required for sulfatase activity
MTIQRKHFNLSKRLENMQKTSYRAYRGCKTFSLFTGKIKKSAVAAMMLFAVSAGTKAEATGVDRAVLETPPQTKPHLQNVLGLNKFEMIFVEGGQFEMGCKDRRDKKTGINTTCYADEKLHYVKLSGFYIGKYEVTQTQWNAIMGENRDFRPYAGANKPAVNVSWDDVQVFINRLNDTFHARYPDFAEWSFCLPTESQWEYAARGGNKPSNCAGGCVFAGSDNIDDVAVHSSRSLAEVGSKSNGANELGLYDMSGNAWEWCVDRYGVYPGGTSVSSPAVNPSGSDNGLYRVIRGGSWTDDAFSCRASFRYSYPPEPYFYVIGLRLVLVPSSLVP